MESSPRQELVLNHSSKASDELKTSGSRKLSRAHSSWRLFCSGVPVNSSLLVVLISRITRDSLLSSFLILCASSITMYFQLNFLKTDFSRGIISSRMKAFLVSWSPMRQTALTVGHHFLNSFIQLARVDFGTRTMCGPETFLKCFM